MASTLVVVHPSSIDSFYEAARDAGVAHVADDLLFMLAEDVLEYVASGKPVIWIDQNWDGSRKRKLDREIGSALEQTIRIHFDELEEDWDALWPKLQVALAIAGTEDVALSGIWYDPDIGSGCALEVANWLRSHGHAVVVSSVGGEADLWDAADEDEDED